MTAAWLLLVPALLAPHPVDAAAAKRRAAPRTDAATEACLACHGTTTPALVEQWKASRHARQGVGCPACHDAAAGEADAFEHYGRTIATIVSPKDCGRCHASETAEFGGSHHAKAANILASLDNRLAEVVEGCRAPFAAHGPTPPERVDLSGTVDGMASVNVGCRQCHGSRVEVTGRDADGKPVFAAGSWPNTGIGRINLDGSLGSCAACHSRHDFSARRARQPENCGKCHLGPDHPQKEIYEESKHGVAYRDLKDRMNLDAERWVLGKDYTQAPTCATCHLSGHAGNGGVVTHDPGQRISWTNRPAVSKPLEGWKERRERMQAVCANCHAAGYVEAFYRSYDEFVGLYDEKFGRPGGEVMAALKAQGLLTPAEFDEPLEWTWYELWHHEGRRARHGASMMAPDYAHWHGMYEVGKSFYTRFVPEVRVLLADATAHGRKRQADAVRAVLDGVLARPEHAWAGAVAP